MSFKSKIVYNAGSMKTVIPSGIVKLLQYKSGDSLKWEVDIKEYGAEVKIIRLPKEE